MSQATEEVDDPDLQQTIHVALQEHLLNLPQLHCDPMVRLVLRRMEEVETRVQNRVDETNMRLEKLESGLSALESEFVVAQEQWEGQRGDASKFKQRLDELVQSSRDSVVELQERLTVAHKRQDLIIDRLWCVEHHLKDRMDSEVLGAEADMLRQVTMDISAEMQLKLGCLEEQLNSKAEIAAVDASLDDLEERLSHKVSYDYLQERMNGLGGRIQVKAESPNMQLNSTGCAGKGSALQELTRQQHQQTRSPNAVNSCSSFLRSRSSPASSTCSPLCSSAPDAYPRQPRSAVARHQSRETEPQAQRRSFVGMRTSHEGDAGPRRSASVRSSSRRRRANRQAMAHPEA